MLNVEFKPQTTECNQEHTTNSIKLSQWVLILVSEIGINEPLRSLYIIFKNYNVSHLLYMHHLSIYETCYHETRTKSPEHLRRYRPLNMFKINRKQKKFSREILIFGGQKIEQL